MNLANLNSFLNGIVAANFVIWNGLKSDSIAVESDSVGTFCWLQSVDDAGEESILGIAEASSYFSAHGQWQRNRVRQVAHKRQIT